METVVSGIRSTGQLHLGNYFGALKNFVKMQHTDRCFFFIADYHSLTTHPDPKALHGNVRNVLAEYLAAGLDPEAATIYIQSDVPQVTELSLLLSMHTYVGELERTASFKDKVPYSYQRRQTLANAERYVTDELKAIEEKILSSSEKSLQMEIALFEQIKGF